MGRHGQDFGSAVLRFVESFVRDNGYPPTYDEIRKAARLSSRSHVLYYLNVLEEEGLIERTPRAPRSLRLVPHRPGEAGARHRNRQKSL